MTNTFIIYPPAILGRHSSLITAVLAVPQVSPIHFPTFPGPISIPLLEGRLANFQATVNISLSKLHLKDAHFELRDLNPYQCHGDRREYCCQDEVPMSQGSSVQRSPSSPFQNNRQSFAPASRESRTLPPINDSYTPRNTTKSVSQSPSLAPSVPNGPYTSQTPPNSDQRPSSRPIEVQNLLNPTASDSSSAADSQSRRRNADHFDMPSALFATGARLLPASSFVPSSGQVALPSLTPPMMNSYPVPSDPASRRTLTPRSPANHVTLLSTLPGTIDAAKSPFGPSREPHKILAPEVKSIPETSLGPPLLYTGPAARSPPDRRTSIGSLQLHSSAERRASVGATSQVHTSQSDSPTTSYSSYSQFSRTPPVSNNQPSSSGYFPAFSAATSSSTITQAGYEAKESFSPVTSSIGQNSYQMTLDTDQGPIQVPVDVQAASKVADEKRKRNATASHRFRQRRKEKERETSQNIAKLEHQLRDLVEEREYYRMERDYFRSLAKNGSSQAPIAPRPTSPRLVRQQQQQQQQHGQLGGAGNNPFGNPNSAGWPPAGGEDHRGNSSGRNTRRRTSSYVPAQGLAPTSSAVSTSNNNNPNLPNNNPPPQQQPLPPPPPPQMPLSIHNLPPRNNNNLRQQQQQQLIGTSIHPNNDPPPPLILGQTETRSSSLTTTNRALNPPPPSLLGPNLQGQAQQQQVHAHSHAQGQFKGGILQPLDPKPPSLGYDQGAWKPPQH